MAKETETETKTAAVETAKPDQAKIDAQEKFNSLDPATQARLKASEAATIKTQTGKLNVQS